MVTVPNLWRHTHSVYEGYLLRWSEWNVVFMFSHYNVPVAQWVNVCLTSTQHRLTGNDFFQNQTSVISERRIHLRKIFNYLTHTSEIRFLFTKRKWKVLHLMYWEDFSLVLPNQWRENTIKYRDPNTLKSDDDLIGYFCRSY